jgi:hypothetical protein
MQWLGHGGRAALGVELANVYVSSTIADLTEERRLAGGLGSRWRSCRMGGCIDERDSINRR